ncbi:MAG: gamma-glutamyl-gamma-aminobutyrate hydrolase family protein [Candidatus Riflebacteria bacterium]|nr:gamma-glutamyl-gamma-aminobutyrate hydrolase family protein [Candidatus Riflebacteria bacterium]
MNKQIAPVIGIAYSDCAARDNEMRIRTYVSRKYYHAVQQSGGIAVLLPAPYIPSNLSELEAERLHAEHINTYMNMVDGIIFAGGEDIDPKYQDEEPISELGQVNPFRDAFEIALAKSAKAKNINMLGICRGIQLLAVALGGKVSQDISKIEKIQHSQKSPRWYASHKIAIKEGSLLQKALKPESCEIRVNSFHHQAVLTLPDGFSACAEASDGIIEAMEYNGDDSSIIGVQWHPEETFNSDAYSRALFSWFVNSCK